MGKVKEGNTDYIILNDVLQNIAKHICYNGNSYRPMFVKMDHYGLEYSFQGFYAKHTPKGFSTENYLFKVQGSDFNEMMRKFLTAYDNLLNQGFISSSTPRIWQHKSIRLEY